MDGIDLLGAVGYTGCVTSIDLASIVTVAISAMVISRHKHNDDRPLYAHPCVVS